MDTERFEIEHFNIYDLPTNKTDQLCPKCSHTRSAKNQKKPCASADWERGLLTCHHCGEVTQLHTYKRIETKAYKRPKINENSYIDSRVVSYFKSRGISAATLGQAKITTRPNWIQFNYWENGELINRKERDAKKNFRLTTGAERIFYNIDSIIGHDWCIITEGEIDCLSFMEAGFKPVVSVPNGAVVGRNNLDYLDSCVGYFERKTKIILALDNDEAGIALQKEFIRRLGPEICYICEFGSHKDANALLVDSGVDGLVNALDAAKPVPLEHVKTINDVEFDKLVEEGFKKGFTSGMDSIDAVFSILDGQFCVVTGIPSSGKSDFIDAYCLGLNKRYGWKTAYASTENFPITYHTHKIFRKRFNRMPVKADIGTERYLQTKQYLADNFYFVDLPSFDLESVLKKGAELVKRRGIKCLVIDPYNKIRLKSALKESVNEYTNRYLNLIDEFARKYNCFVFLVAHPIKLQKRESGYYPCPSFYDVKGGGEMYDMSPNGLAIHRDGLGGQTLVKVLKVKFQFQGQNGGEAYFNWNKHSGNFISTEKELLPWEE